MGEKSSIDILLDRMPSLSVWYNVVFLYIFQILVFLGVMVFFWWISSRFFYGAILGQTVVSSLLSIHYIVIANNCEKIRDKFKKKSSNLAWQSFWYKYQSYTTPVISAAFYFPLVLYKGYGPLPVLYPQPSHFINNGLLPFYVSLILGFIIVIIGFLMKRHSGSYGKDFDDYFHVIYPEKSKLLTDGMYKYIRNPQYLSRGIISIGFGVIANNISAIIVGLIHFISYCAIIPAEDKELGRRFGEDFESYKKRVPAIFPRFGHYRDFIKFIFIYKNG